MKRPENEGDQAKDVKVHGARGVPAPYENEQANEQIEEAYDSQVILGCEGLFGRGGEDWRFEFLSSARKLVAYLGPQPRAVQPLSDFRGSFDSSAIDRQQDVARANPCASCRRIGRNTAGLNSMFRVGPAHTVGDSPKAEAP